MAVYRSELLLMKALCVFNKDLPRFTSMSYNFTIFIVTDFHFYCSYLLFLLLLSLNVYNHTETGLIEIEMFLYFFFNSYYINLILKAWFRIIFYFYYLIFLSLYIYLVISHKINVSFQTSSLIFE